MRARGPRRVLACLLALVLPGAAAAQCDVTYIVRPGDTLFTMAEAHYGDREGWALIFYANREVLDGIDQATPGSELFIPCPSAAAGGDIALPAPAAAGLTLLTAGDAAPLMDRDWPGQGMITELVTAALAAGPAPLPHTLVWEEDRSRHLFPLLDDKTYDMGFAWVKPDCTADPAPEICEAFHFSDPLLELPMMLFIRNGGGFTYGSDADIPGHRLCRPAGRFAHDLDRPDRRWLSEGKITLIQPATVEACFEALMQDKVDAVSVDLFVGASRIVAMGLRGKVVPIDQPLSQETLHVVISRTHWRGTTHLYRLNAGLAALRANGQYDTIVARHLDLFWTKLK